MIELTVDPSHVYALVVGIEQYQAGPAYDLNGPAKDALGFAHWLLTRGVQPANIQLFLSPLEQNREVLAEAETQGLNPQEATRDRISRTITEHFVDQGGREKGLYVFWAGHGFITKLDATIRRLLFADTDTRNKWNLNFDTLLQAFQSAQHGAVFPRQIFVVDACANPMFRDFYPTLQAAAAGEEFVTSGTQGQAEQFALFAAAEYAVATNLTQAGTGRFSRAVLEELQAQPLWPDMSELARKIKANFRDQQHLEPVFWSVSLGGGDREVTDTISQKITARPAPAIATSRSERFQLIKTLNDLPVVEFEVLVNTLNPPSGLVPPSSAAQGLRSPALLQWIEGPTGPGLNELQAILGQVMVRASKAQYPDNSTLVGRDLIQAGRDIIVGNKETYTATDGSFAAKKMTFAGPVVTGIGTYHAGDTVQGDKIGGDKVGSEKITVGTIRGSQGIAMGAGSCAEVQTRLGAGSDPKDLENQTLSALLSLLRKTIVHRGAELTEDDQADALDCFASLERFSADRQDSALKKSAGRDLRNLKRLLGNANAPLLAEIRQKLSL